MLAADAAEAAFDFVPDEMVATESTDPIAVDEWQAWDPVVCDLQPYDFVDPKPAVDPVIIDDSSLLVEDSWLMVYEPIDNANDPAVLISDYGDGWWIDGFPLELAPPVPEQTVFYGGDQTVLDEYADEGTVDPSGSFNITSDWSSSSFNVASGWSSSGTDAVFTWDGNAGFGGDEPSTWDDSGELYIGDNSLLEFSDDWTGTFLPLAYARGADVSESFAAYAAAADAEPAEPVAVSPRSAAFADMGAMAAALTATQASSADATSIGGRRRRR